MSKPFTTSETYVHQIGILQAATVCLRLSRDYQAQRDLALAEADLNRVRWYNAKIDAALECVEELMKASDA